MAAARSVSQRGGPSLPGCVRPKTAPLLVALLVTGVYAAYVLWRLQLMGHDPSSFVVAGPPVTDPTTTLPNLHVWPSGVTYDGQFFYRLALQPWTTVGTAYGVTLDLPAYRQERILYPALAWLLSAGNWRLTPVALIVANLLSVGVLAYAAAAFATLRGRSALLSVMVPFYPAYVVTISRDLSELTEAATLMLGLVLLQQRRHRAAATALVASMLTRETMLVIPLVGCALWAANRARGRPGPRSDLLVWLAPVVGYAAWCSLLWIRWGTNPIGEGAGNFGTPFAALAEHIRTLGIGTAAWRANALEIALLALVGITVMLVLATYRSRVLDDVLPAACIAYAVLAVCYTSFVWADDHAYLRALHELFFTGGLALVARGVWSARIPGLVTTGLWLAFALQSGPAP